MFELYSGNFGYLKEMSFVISASLSKSRSGFLKFGSSDCEGLFINFARRCLKVDTYVSKGSPVGLLTLFCRMKGDGMMYFLIPQYFSGLVIKQKLFSHNLSFGKQHVKEYKISNAIIRYAIILTTSVVNCSWLKINSMPC